MVDDNLDSVRQTREALEHQAQHEAWKRRWKRFFVGTSTLLAVGLAALAVYAFSIAHRADGSLARLDSMDRDMSELSQQQRSTAAKFTIWDTERDQLRQQLDKTGSDILRRAEGIRKQTTDSVDSMIRKLQARTDGQVNQLQAKVTTLETERSDDRAQVASLQKELGQVRGEVARQGEVLTAARGDITATNLSAQRQLAVLTASNEKLLDSTQRNGQAVDRINKDLSNQTMDRFDFEVAKGKVQQITPNIQLSLTNVDLRFHRADGWMFVMPDRRTIWLRKQSTSEPVLFYGHDDGKKRELVITDLTKNSMIGYLLLPKGTSGGTVVAAAQ